MYESFLKPLVGQIGIEVDLRNFWLLFAGMGLLATGGLIVYNRMFAEDTPKASQLAWRVMVVVYSGLVLLGGWFFMISVSGAEVSYKTMVQAVIMLVIGIGGVAISLRSKQGGAAGWSPKE